MIPPQLSGVKLCAKCPEQAYFDINCTHIKFTNKHIALSIQFTALPLYIFIITKVISEKVSKTSNIIASGTFLRTKLQNVHV